MCLANPSLGPSEACKELERLHGEASVLYTHYLPSLHKVSVELVLTAPRTDCDLRTIFFESSDT